MQNRRGLLKPLPAETARPDLSQRLTVPGRLPVSGIRKPVQEDVQGQVAAAAAEPVPTAPSVEDELLTDEDMMDWLKVPKSWLRNHTTRTEPIIPHIKMGREIRYRRSEISAFLKSLGETRPAWKRKSNAE